MGHGGGFGRVRVTVKFGSKQFSPQVFNVALKRANTEHKLMHGHPFSIRVLIRIGRGVSYMNTIECGKCYMKNIFFVTQNNRIDL